MKCKSFSPTPCTRYGAATASGMPTATSDSDVIVIGGGPAGSAAAIACAQRGLSVVLYEARQFPREHPGETLHPGVEPLLFQLGVDQEVFECEFIRHFGIRTHSGVSHHHLPFGANPDGTPWRGFQAYRADFDNILLNRAIRVGVRVTQNRRATRPVLENGRVVGVIAAGAETRCKYLVDASG